MKIIQDFLQYLFDVVHKGLNAIGITDAGLAYVLAIAVLTLLIKIVLLPLNIKQMRSQAAMQEIQPELKKLQDKYKNDPQKQQAEMMKLYKEHNVSPFSGCLPLIIQMPILFALYYVFQKIDFGGATFLGIDLAANNSAIGIPFSLILPILAGASTYLSSWLLQRNNSNKNNNNNNAAPAMNMGGMNIGMSIFMGVMAFNFKSALVMYWIINSLLQALQSYLLVILPAKRKAKEAK
ncbi:membrane protein insertase YidC [Alloiococcus sp. CFN-8]|uniref:membrane protein insertase YidC n=1 Tax=Alloiococcus sp. CFN-8 TaxID=3416081 RepID=UPI003CE8FB39